MSATSNLNTSLEDIFKEFSELHKQPEPVRNPPTKLTLGDDPVALAWGSYQVFVRTNGAQRWYDIGEVTADAECRVKAEEIRKYYRDRILLQTLTTAQPLSEYRRRLYEILNGPTDIYNTDLGLLYRLPYFYVEDTALDRVIEQTNSIVDPERSSSMFGVETVAEYTLLERVLQSRRRQEVVQFWLKSSADSHLYMIACLSNNPMLPLLESVLKRPTALKSWVFTKEHRGHHRGKHYFQLGSAKVV